MRKFFITEEQAATIFNFVGKNTTTEIGRPFLNQFDQILGAQEIKEPDVKPEPEDGKQI